MEAPFSPIIRKVTGEIAASSKQSSSRRTEVVLEEWWLSKPKSGKGLAVSGRPMERRYDDPQRNFHSAPAKRRSASREFHSTEIVKKHGCATLETADGLTISLCGFINRSRTQQNGFSSEVCRDFIFGFPINWEDHAASVCDKSSQVNLRECTVSPADLDAYNGAQLHDLVLSLSDTEKALFNKKAYDNLIETLNPQPTDRIESPPSKSSGPQVGVDGVTSKSSSKNTSKKRRR
ncbi:hypothetical protein RDABS01_032974 [Bienertia sinuspersici]